MLQQRRIGLKIALMALGMLTVLMPNTWAGPKQRHHRRHLEQVQDFTSPIYRTVLKQDGYCPPQVTTNRGPGKSTVIVIGPCKPGCPYCPSGLTVYDFATQGLADPNIKVLSSTSKDFKGPHPLLVPTRDGTTEYIIRDPAYYALIGSRNLLLKLQYVDMKTKQVYTVFTTILLIKSH